MRVAHSGRAISSAPAARASASIGRMIELPLRLRQLYIADWRTEIMPASILLRPPLRQPLTHHVFEHTRCCVECCARRHDIIDKQNLFLRETVDMLRCNGKPPGFRIRCAFVFLPCGGVLRCGSTDQPATSLAAGRHHAEYARRFQQTG